MTNTIRWLLAGCLVLPGIAVSALLEIDETKQYGDWQLERLPIQGRTIYNASAVSRQHQGIEAAFSVERRTPYCDQVRVRLFVPIEEPSKEEQHAMGMKATFMVDNRPRHTLKYSYKVPAKQNLAQLTLTPGTDLSAFYQDVMEGETLSATIMMDGKLVSLKFPLKGSWDAMAKGKQMCSRVAKAESREAAVFFH